MTGGRFHLQFAYAVDSLLDGVDAGNMTQLAVVVLTVLIAAWLLWRRPGAFARRHVLVADSPS